MKKCNYHTHTYRCMHACGSDEDYVISAIKGGYQVLGFSDHAPWNYESDFVAHMRMPLVQFHEYAESIRKLKEKGYAFMTYSEFAQIKLAELNKPDEK